MIKVLFPNRVWMNIGMRKWQPNQHLWDRSGTILSSQNHNPPAGGQITRLHLPSTRVDGGQAMTNKEHIVTCLDLEAGENKDLRFFG